MTASEAAVPVEQGVVGGGQRGLEVGDGGGGAGEVGVGDFEEEEERDDGQVGLKNKVEK